MAKIRKTGKGNVKIVRNSLFGAKRQEHGNDGTNGRVDEFNTEKSLEYLKRHMKGQWKSAQASKIPVPQMTQSLFTRSSICKGSV